MIYPARVASMPYCSSPMILEAPSGVVVVKSFVCMNVAISFFLLIVNVTAFNYIVFVTSLLLSIVQSISMNSFSQSSTVLLSGM